MNVKHKIEPEQYSPLQFEHVWVREASFVDVAEEYTQQRGDRDIDAEIRIELKLRMQPDKAFVTLRAVLDAKPDKKLFVTLVAAVEGAFSLRAGEDPNRLTSFATFQAPVLLVPYVRQVITNLTAQSRIGPIVLPPLNMVEVIKMMAPQTVETAAPAGTT